MSVIETIMQLKRTATPQFPTGMTWHEIGKRLGMSKQGAHCHAKKLLNDPKHPRCPSCLQPLKKEKADPGELIK